MKLINNYNLCDNIYNIIFNSNNKEIEEFYNDMSKYQKNIFNNFKENKDIFNNYSLNDLVYDFDRIFVEKILNLELDLYLKECHESNIDNRKNGETKNVSIIVGNNAINFNRPRARLEKNFDSVIIPKRTKIMKDITDDILLLYSKNNSVQDIKQILKGMFKIDISTTKISELINSIHDEILSWRNRDISRFYFTLNIDCFYISIRDSISNHSHDVPVYVAIGTKIDGHKEIAGIYLGNEDEHKNIISSLCDKDIAESKSFWLNVFGDLKDRGLKDVLFIISDGVVGIENAINLEFPNSKHQRCIVHLTRNVADLVPVKDRKTVVSDFKCIYSAESLEIAETRFEDFLEKYKDKKNLIKHVTNYFQYIKSLFNVPINIRKYIYTNNIVESANSKVQRGFYGRGSLPNAQAAINIIYHNLIDLENKWQKNKVNNWDNIFHEINTLFYDKIKDYL